ncbi:MAG: efflux RND transporter periplasmic adaptor subunit [Hungatella sp.]
MKEKNQLEKNEILGEADKSEETFDAELQVLMQEDTSGKKKKKEKKERKKWSKKLKVVLAVAVIAALIVVIAAVSAGKNKAQEVVMTTSVVRGDMVENLSLSGPISGTDSVDVVSNLHAEVLEIAVKEGDSVQKDQLLAVIDSRDIEKEIEIAQNAYDLAVSTYKEQQIAAENGYAKARQDYQAAKTEYDRTNVLFEAQSVSALELETVKNRMQDAERQLKTFTLQNGKAVANESYTLQIKSAEFTLEKKKTLLENTKITSPIAGTVVRVNTKVGRFADKIEDDKPMFIIENLDVLEMKIKVSEYSIGKIQVGQEASIRADILGGETVTGEVTDISPTGEEKGGGSTERVIPTTIRIAEKNTKLIAGITAKAQIALNESRDTLIVPISSLLQKEDGLYLASVQNNMIKLIPVEHGVQNDIQTEVLAIEGSVIEEGTQVVISPTENLTDGLLVVVQPAM